MRQCAAFIFFTNFNAMQHNLLPYLTNFPASPSPSPSPPCLTFTFEDLEPQHLRHFRSLNGKPIWSIGRVLPPSSAEKVGRGKMADIIEDELVQGMDSQRPRLLVYVSFGSKTLLSESQTIALARGLESSEQPFVWEIKVIPKLEPMTADTEIRSCN